jgi:hypothetical protein
VGLRFATVPQEGLDVAERDTIARLQTQGVKLRNVALVTLPLHSEALDYVIDPALQQEWLEGVAGEVVLGDRAAIAAQRKKTRSAFERLAERNDYQEILEILACYVGACFLYPQQTERRFWTVTSLPSTGRGPDLHRLAAISANNVETLVLLEVLLKNGHWDWCGYVNVALGDTRLRVPGARSDIGEYRTVGQVQRFYFDSASGLRELLETPRVGAAARKLAVGLLRKGSGMMSRFHDYNLADDIFIKLDSSSSRP